MFNATDAAVDIAHGHADVHITETGSDIYDAPVYLFTENGSYLGRVQRTDSAGLARFLIPAGAYKFRVDCNGTQYWSDVINVLPDEETAVDLALDLLAMDLTNDPDPVRFDGKPPKFEKEPVFLASLFDITGLLARKVFADTGDDDAVYYYINDHLGTARLIIDESNHIVWRGDYQPFGSVNAVVSDLGNNFRFAGQYYDEETGLHYNYFRYYNPATGRYLTPDPIGLAGGIIPYTYVSNNPANLIDPFGLITLPEIYAKVETFAKPYTIGGALITTGGVTTVAGSTLTVVGYGSILETGPAGALAGTAGVVVTTTGVSMFTLGLDVYADELRDRLGLPKWFDVLKDFELLPKHSHEEKKQRDCE